jgi:hypothetical protein
MISKDRLQDLQWYLSEVTYGAYGEMTLSEFLNLLIMTLRKHLDEHNKGLGDPMGEITLQWHKQVLPEIEEIWNKLLGDN